jgi:hypothetical protein
MIRTIAIALLATITTAFALPEGVTIRKDESSRIAGTVTYTVAAPQQKAPNKVEVLLPSNLDPARRYAYVICLPVNTGIEPKFGHPLAEAIKHDLANRHQLIFVAPAYDVEPWFGDHPTAAAPRQQAYVTDALIPALEQALPIRGDAGGRFLVGFSKSGLGALGLMLRNPDQFARVAAFDSYMGQPTDEQFTKWGFAASYGTRENYDRFDPMLLASKAKDAFKGKPDRRFVILAGGPGSRIGVDMFVQKLKDEQIPFTYVLQTNAGHHWETGWLPLAVAGLQTPPPLPADPDADGGAAK